MSDEPVATEDDGSELVVVLAAAAFLDSKMLDTRASIRLR